MQQLLDFGAYFSQIFIGLLTWCIFLRVILSWFPVPPSGFTRFLSAITEPLLASARKLPISRIGMLDLSPIVAFFGLELIGWLLRLFFLELGVNPNIYIL